MSEQCCAQRHTFCLCWLLLSKVYASCCCQPLKEVLPFWKSNLSLTPRSLSPHEMPLNKRQTHIVLFLLLNPWSRRRVDLLPCIQLNNVSAAIATAEEHGAAPPACAMDVTRGNGQSEVPIPLYERCEDGGMEWVGFRHHASASNRTRGSSVFVTLDCDWSRIVTFPII